MALVETLRSVKNSLVSNRTECGRVPFGLAAGCVLPVNLRRQSRMFLGLYER